MTGVEQIRKYTTAIEENILLQYEFYKSCGIKNGKGIYLFPPEI